MTATVAQAIRRIVDLPNDFGALPRDFRLTRADLAVFPGRTLQTATSQ